MTTNEKKEICVARMTLSTVPALMELIAVTADARIKNDAFIELRKTVKMFDHLDLSCLTAEELAKVGEARAYVAANSAGARRKKAR